MRALIRQDGLLLAALLVGCAEDCPVGFEPGADGNCYPGSGPDDPDDTGTTGDSGGDDSGESGGGDDSGPVSWQTLPEVCEGPGDVGPDPIVMLGSDQQTEYQLGDFFMELVDLEWVGDWVYGVGQGGLVIYDVSDPAAPRLVGVFAGPLSRFYRVEPLSEDVLALTHRDEGIFFVDISDPTSPVELSRLSGRGYEGMARIDDHLLVSVRGEGLRPFDISDPRRPQALGLTGGPPSVWELTPPRSGWVYAADNLDGVVPIDVSDPSRPQAGQAVALDGPALHVAVDGDHLYASIGGPGVVVLSLEDPSAPRAIATAPTGGSAVMSAASDGLLWVADHESVSVFDVSDPAAPRAIGHEITEQFALAIRSRGERAWVGDWTILSGWEANRGAEVGELDLSADIAVLPMEGGAANLHFTNRGAGPLRLSGARVDDSRVSVEVSTDQLAPGEQGALRLSWDGGAGMSTTLCLASDDPDGGVQQVQVVAGVQGDLLGNFAPDFVLPGLDGQSYALSEQLGEVVLLDYFALW